MQEAKPKELTMKISPLVLLALLVSCTKNIDAPSSQNKLQPAVATKPEVCDFGIHVFNRARRAPSQNMYSGKKKSRNGSQSTTASDATILLDFDGYTVNNTVWNIKGTINAAPANLTEAEVDKIMERVSEDFSPFDVVVTTDEAVYNATNPYKRVRAVITETWEWFGLAGGVSYNGSFSWGDNTPCFIFSTLLSYNEKYISEAISHEVGHTLGLLHQAVYDGACTFISEYNQGIGEGVTGWAPIMGVGYYRNVTTWHKGPTVFGCNSIQDDVAIISKVLGMQPDDNGNMNKSEKFDTSADGIMNTSNDIDYYYIDAKQPVTLIAEPKCLGNGEGANLSLQINLYDRRGDLIKTVSNASALSVNVALGVDKYFVGVETVANQYQSRYGMLGRYSLRTE